MPISWKNGSIVGSRRQRCALQAEPVRELFEVGRKVFRGILDHMDEELMKSSKEGLHHLEMRERTILARLGVLRVKRRY